ncbi:MAG: hypothetical protein FIA97_09360 [Methylococcaceae bacterium]|nr:hypothetical protein [Methylococcaceae bacterium]
MHFEGGIPVMPSGLGHHIDTSDLRPNALRAIIKGFVQIGDGAGLTLTFESFGFNHGLPFDADLVFDVRCLPNPHYDPALRPLTGLDAPVMAFLGADAEVQRMIADIGNFVDSWLPTYVRDNRSYLTVAIGCSERAGGRIALSLAGATGKDQRSFHRQVPVLRRRPAFRQEHPECQLVDHDRSGQPVRRQALRLRPDDQGTPRGQGIGPNWSSPPPTRPRARNTTSSR